MSGFVPGLELSRAFYEEVVAPLVGDVPHSAALLGTGSDVLGFDTARSTDHGWGPRVHVFVDPEDVDATKERIEHGLPETFHGWPTRFGWDETPVTHHVLVAPLRGWLLERLSFDPLSGVDLWDWLATPQQALLEMTRGAVFRDDFGDLAAVRSALAWYPDDVWLWLLACQWRRLDQEEPFVGRAAEVDDELGSRVLVGRIARDIVHLCFLLERRYAPYSKWLGTAFRELGSYRIVGEPLLEALSAMEYATREDALMRAVQAVAALHNAAGVTATVDESIGLFHSRPYRVLGSGRFVDACLARVTEPRLRALPLFGSIDQFTDSTDVSSDPIVARSVTALYERLV